MRLAIRSKSPRVHMLSSYWKPVCSIFNLVTTYSTANKRAYYTVDGVLLKVYYIYVMYMYYMCLWWTQVSNCGGRHSTVTLEVRGWGLEVGGWEL